MTGATHETTGALALTCRDGSPVQVRNLLVVLSAAVIAGLGVYFAFNCIVTFSLVGGNVSMHVNSFVALIACLCLAAAALSLLLRAAVVRTDRQQTQLLEQRVERLEQGRPTSPS